MQVVVALMHELADRPLGPRVWSGVLAGLVVLTPIAFLPDPAALALLVGSAVGWLTALGLYARYRDLRVVAAAHLTWLPGWTALAVELPVRLPVSGFEAWQVATVLAVGATLVRDALVVSRFVQHDRTGRAVSAGGGPRSR